MKMKKRIVVLLMALVLAVGLIGCKDTLKSIVHKASGTSDEVQEEDTTRWADQTSDPLIIQGIADSSAKFATATADALRAILSISSIKTIPRSASSTL